MEMGVERFGGEGDAECLLMGMLGGLAGQCVLVSLWVGPGPPCPPPPGAGSDVWGR